MYNATDQARPDLQRRLAIEELILSLWTESLPSTVAPQQRLDTCLGYQSSASEENHDGQQRHHLVTSRWQSQIKTAKRTDALEFPCRQRFLPD